MAQSTLIFYDCLSSARDDERAYWEKYINFYEKYWGGPMSPFGIWFGTEYRDFRRKAAEHLLVDPPDLRDCFFIKDSEGRFYFRPLGSEKNPSILACENAVAFEWLAAFDESGRRNFYSHWGFSSIHYNAKASDAAARIKSARRIFSRSLEKTGNQNLRPTLEWMRNGAKKMDDWFSARPSDGYAVLNYGDICSALTPQSLDRERSVEQVAEILTLLDAENWQRAYSLAMRLLGKWENLRQICEAANQRKPLQ